MYMFIVRLTGGLGNQMFQYSLYIKLKEQGHKVLLFADSNKLKEHNGMELNRLFEHVVIKRYRFLQLYFVIYPYLQQIGWFLDKYKLNFISRIYFFNIITFPSWANYQLSDYELERIKYIFSFPSIDDKVNLQIQNRIRETNSVSIHVRRGDYVKSPIYRRTHGNICTSEYYAKSIDYILQRVRKPVFFIFSDDIQWAKDNLCLDDAYYISENKGLDSYKDMQLISMCKYNIIANSTFSAWGAILNSNFNKIVIAPKKWINNHFDKTLQKIGYPDWIIIDNNIPIITLWADGMKLSNKNIDNLLKQTHSDYCVVSDTIIDDDRFVFNALYKKTSLINIELTDVRLEALNDHFWIEKQIYEYYEENKR